MRSRQTGQVGSSIRAGVGGAIGFVFKDVDWVGMDCPFVVGRAVASVFVAEGVKGSFVISGKEASFPGVSSARNSIDLTKTT